MNQHVSLQIKEGIKQLSLNELLWLIERLTQRIRELTSTTTNEETLNETEWLSAGTHNPAFADLYDAAEDIYSLADGEPFHDELANSK